MMGWRTKTPQARGAVLLLILLNDHAGLRCMCLPTDSSD